MEYKYKCEKCGNEWFSDRRGLLGFGTPECECGGAGVRVIKCDICQDEYRIKETWGYSSHICDNCINEYKNDIETCRKVGREETERIEISSFFTRMLDKEDIEQILYETLKEVHGKKPLDFTPFINMDRDWFADCLEEVSK